MLTLQNYKSYFAHSAGVTSVSREEHTSGAEQHAEALADFFLSTDCFYFHCNRGEKKEQR